MGISARGSTGPPVLPHAGLGRVEEALRDDPLMLSLIDIAVQPHLADVGRVRQESAEVGDVPGSAKEGRNRGGTRWLDTT